MVCVLCFGFGGLGLGLLFGVGLGFEWVLLKLWVLGLGFCLLCCLFVCWLTDLFCILDAWFYGFVCYCLRLIN